jgi:excisionase family DNA binding protein
MRKEGDLMAHAPGGRPRKQIAVDPAALPDKPYFTVGEVVALTGLHKETIQARLQDGTLSGKKLGGIWKIYRSSLVNDKVDADLNIENQ